MKSRNIILLAASMVLALASCGKEDGKKDIEDSIKLSTEAVDFNFGSGESAIVNIQTESSWEIEGLDDGVKQWLEIDKTSGVGDAVINLKCIEYNPWTIKRISVLSFVAGKASADLVVKQLPDPDRSVCTDIDEIQFAPAAGESFTIEVITNKPWTLEGLDDVKSWLTVSPQSGEKGCSVAVQSTAINEEVADRIAKIGFRIDRVNCAEVALTQPSGVELSISSSEMTFAPAGNETQKLSISSNATSKDWTIEGVEEASEWLKFDKTSGKGDADVSISTLSRNDDLVRSASFTVRIDEVHFKEFTVMQNSSLEIHLNPKSLTFEGTGSSTQTTVVTSTSATREWYVEGYTDEVKAWMTLDTEKFTGTEKTITISTLGENSTSADRVAVLKFHLTDTIFEELTVTQQIKPLETKVLSWSGSNNILAKEGQAITKFPYNSAGNIAVTTALTDGVGGAQKYTGNVTDDIIYHISKPEPFDMLIAPIYKPASSNTALFCGYMTNNATFSQIWSVRCAFEIPAIKGFKLTKIEMTCGNAASSNCLCIGNAIPDRSLGNGSYNDRMKALEAPKIENLYNITFGKPDPFSHEFTTTEAGKTYYFYFTANRLLTGFTFTYTEVR